MYPTSEEKAVVDAANNLMIETMARYDPSHDAFHVQRVRKTALSIAHAAASSDRKPDLLTVELAALLHDSVDLIADGRAREIARIVENVSWSTEKKLRQQGEWGPWHEQCVELHCVQDADRLDAIGAFGVLRCAAYSAVTNIALHVPPGDAAKRDSAIQHFHDKLLNIRDRLKTEPGRRMGRKRHQMMVDFLASVEEEYNAEI